MKSKLALVAALISASLLLPGCMLPKYSRLVPENKSARIRIVNPMYGYIEIDTRVVGDTNALPPLPQPTVIVGPSN